MTFHIGAAGPGTDEGVMKTTIPSPAIASASGTSMAAFGGRSFCARTRTAITDVQVTFMRPSGGQLGDGRAHPLGGSGGPRRSGWVATSTPSDSVSGWQGTPDHGACFVSTRVR